MAIYRMRKDGMSIIRHHLDLINALTLIGPGTTGIEMTDSFDTGINFKGEFGTALSLSGTITTALNIGACTTGINIGGTCEKAIIIGTSSVPIAYTVDSCEVLDLNVSYQNVDSVGKVIAAQIVLGTAGVGSMTCIRGWAAVDTVEQSGGDAFSMITGLQGTVQIGASGTVANDNLWLTGVIGQIRTLPGSALTSCKYAAAFAVMNQLSVKPISGDVIGLYLPPNDTLLTDYGILMDARSFDVGIKMTGYAGSTTAIDIAGGTFTTGINIAAACTTGIEFSSTVANCIKYTTTTVQTGAGGHLIHYGAALNPIMLTPDSGSAGAIRMYIDSDAPDNTDISGIHCKVTHSPGTQSNAGVLAGSFWTIAKGLSDATRIVGGYWGVRGVIEVASGATINDTGGTMIASGVTGEVRPITGTITKIGKLAAIWAKVQANASGVSSGSLCGIYVSTELESATIDYGIQIDAIATTTITTGIDIGGSGTITTGIAVGTCATAGITLVENTKLCFGDSNEIAISWTGQELLFEDTRTIDVEGGDGGYNRTIHVGSDITMAASRYAAVSCYTTLVNAGADGIEAFGGKFCLAQDTAAAVTGYFGAVMAEVKNKATSCSTACALFLRWDNDAATGFGGVNHSFIRLDDNSSEQKCTNLFEMYLMNANASAANNVIVCQVGSAATASHVIKITANGIPYWIGMSSTPPA